MISCNKMEIAGMREEGNGNGTFNDGEVSTCKVMRANGTALRSLVASNKVPMTPTLNLNRRK